MIVLFIIIIVVAIAIGAYYVTRKSPRKDPFPRRKWPHKQPDQPTLRNLTFTKTSFVTLPVLIKDIGANLFELAFVVKANVGPLVVYGRQTKFVIRKNLSGTITAELRRDNIIIESITSSASAAETDYVVFTVLTENNGVTWMLAVGENIVRKNVPQHILPIDANVYIGGAPFFNETNEGTIKCFAFCGREITLSDGDWC